ncbi:hypothetical protein HHK36_010070 [Tetracentron sinense]|uniref:NAC domain-containing protein n=1 Tax=Tetracentron sinense TaxID=13715 RepID=A0A834ZK59_TETSI|nr:hypothetical protein HHK36_010070 [Tetracentron sinense]
MDGRDLVLQPLIAGVSSSETKGLERPRKLGPDFVLLNWVTMHPSAPVPPPVDISFHLTDKELVMCLERMSSGAPVPSNVLTEVNPYDFSPCDLPGNIWYFFNWEEPKATRTGFWEVKGEACSIFANSTITGWKIIHEFIEAPRVKTDWVMHEYRIIQNVVRENSKEKDSSSLGRVFRKGGQSSNHEMQHNLTSAEGKYDRVQNGVENKHNGQSSRSMPQVISRASENGPLAVHERHLLAERPDFPIEDQQEIYDGGDFLELLDLANPESPSSSSENSSCLTMSSDEGFDSLDLLRDLESENNQDMQQNHSNFSISASLKLNQVVIRPASLGSPPGSDKSKLPREETINLNPSPNNKASKREISTSSSQNAVASSKGHGAAMTGERKAAGGRLTKSQKKYWCCFMPF